MMTYQRSASVRLAMMGFLFLIASISDSCVTTDETTILPAGWTTLLPFCCGEFSAVDSCAMLTSRCRVGPDRVGPRVSIRYQTRPERRAKPGLLRRRCPASLAG